MPNGPVGSPSAASAEYSDTTGFSFCAWVNPGATGDDLPVLAPATLQVGGSSEDPGFLVELEFAEQFLLDGLQRSVTVA